jgi:hypothetical protein
MRTSMRLPVQSPGNTVSVNVSQFTPSTQVLSPLCVPPTAVPFHESGPEAGWIEPDVGFAARIRKIDSPHPKLITTNTTKEIERFLLIIRVLFGYESNQDTGPVPTWANFRVFTKKVEAAVTDRC